MTGSGGELLGSPSHSLTFLALKISKDSSLTVTLKKDQVWTEFRFLCYLSLVTYLVVFSGYSEHRRSQQLHDPTAA
jgi:hypothetical protein